MAPPRNDRKRGRSDDKQPPESTADVLYVLGVAATIHEAAGPCVEELLHSWSGDVCVTIDRFDVRALLDSWAPPPEARRYSACEEQDGAVLNDERYSSLKEAEQLERDEAAAKRAREEEDTHAQDGAFNAVSFAYGNAVPAEEPALPPPPPLERYVPPFALPAHLSTDNLPLTARDGAVISRTAAYVRSSGPQSEIVLRVRHADNARFGFLHVGHPWHPFYRHLVTHDPEAAVKSAQHSLAMLTAIYGEDDAVDEELAALEHSAPPAAEVAGCTGSTPGEAVPPPADGLPTCVLADEPVPPAADADPSQPSAEVLTVMDKLIGFVVKDGPAFEAVTRKRQAHNPNFSFLHPWSPLNVVYLRRLAAARGDQLPGDDGGVPPEAAAGAAATVVGSIPAAAPAPRQRRRWDVAPVAGHSVGDAGPPSEEHNAAAAHTLTTEEEARKAERLKRAREFTAQRAATVQASVVSAHVSLTGAHRAALLAGDDGDDDLPPPPQHDVAPPRWQPPKLIASVPAPARSLADAHADRLTAAVRAAKARGDGGGGD